MLFPPLDSLSRADESAAFVALAWQELFDSDTPDSYRPLPFDVRFLVAELSDLAQLARDDSRWRRHIKTVQEELQQTATSEQPWLRSHHWSASLLDKLGATKDLHEVGDLAAVFRSTSPDAMTTLVDALRREAESLPKNKKRTLECLRLLAAHARQHGWMPTDTSVVGNNEDIVQPLESVVDRISASLTRQERKFTCIVRLHGELATTQSVFQGSPQFRLARIRDYPNDQQGRTFRQEGSGDGAAVLFERVAVSHQAAADQAIGACRRIVDIYNLYRNRPSLEISPRVLVNDGRRTSVISRRTEQSLGTIPQRNARSLAWKALDHLPSGALHEGLWNALEHHSLALASVDAKAGLVAMWTAFECLVGREERVFRWIPPIVALRQIEKDLRYLAICCHRHFSANNLHPPQFLARSTGYYVSPRDVVEALTCKTSDTLALDQLLAEVAHHPLLRFRLHQSWCNFHNPAALARQLDKSRAHLEWNLARIYRARNMIVHMGQVPRFASELTAHLQYYFSRCVTQIIRDLKKHPSRTLSMTLEHNRHRFFHVSQYLRQDASQVSGSHLFPNDDDFEGYFPWNHAGNTSTASR